MTHSTTAQHLCAQHLSMRDAMHASCKLWLTETAQNSTLPRGQSQLTRIITRKHACTCNCSGASLRTQCTLLIVSRASTATVAHNLCSQLPRVGATLVRCHMHALFALLNQSCLVSMGSSPCSALHCSTSPDWPAWAQPHALLCSALLPCDESSHNCLHPNACTAALYNAAQKATAALARAPCFLGQLRTMCPRWPQLKQVASGQCKAM